MFRFWTSESRGCDKTTEATTQQHTVPPLIRTGDYFSALHNTYDATGAPLAPASAESAHSSRFLKRSRSDGSDVMMPPSPSTELDPPPPDEQLATYPPTKRMKTEVTEPAWPAAFAVSYGSGACDTTDEKLHVASSLSSPPSPPPSVSFSMADAAMIEQVKDTVQHQFGLEILVKHNELRLIEQELAKCQIALEQLRRCHLIPYPVNCPTPTQMLDVASGRGVVVRPRPGAAVPKWAAPFGVVDGPYARHYAKWLIPDPAFDGPLPNWPGLAPPARSRASATAEARAARSIAHDASKGRLARGVAGQKLHSLSSGYPQAKDKAGPCVLRRSDGKVVKLVCIDCQRENFSSTQGFINHCRIAHKRDFKSHEEAAVHCGHPVESDSTAPVPNSSKSGAAPPAGSPAAPATVSNRSALPAHPTPAGASLLVSHAAGPVMAPRAPGQVHPLARSDGAVTDTLLRDIETSFQECSQAPATASVTAPAKRAPVKSSLSRSSSSAERLSTERTPFLARFLEGKQFSGSLDACVQDATEAIDLDDNMWAGDENEGFTDSVEFTPATTPGPLTATRALARPTQSEVSYVPGTDGASDHRRSVAQPDNSHMGMTYDAANVTASSMTFVKTEGLDETTDLFGHEEMDVDMSPNAAASNNAPSLVSDDGEYDDSDDGSASETSHTDLDSVSDVPEINMDEDEDQAHGASRGLHHHRGSVKIKKDEAKHVALVNAVPGADN